MMEIHIDQSASFVVATTNNKRFKKTILTILDPNYELGFCEWGVGVTVDNVQGENIVTDAIFPNLQTFHP